MGFTVVIPGTNSSQPLITSSANTLEDAGTNAVSITVTHILAGATNLGTITASTVLVPAGAEVQGNARRLFIYTGVSQLAMITGDGTAVTAVNRPAADWSTQFPTFGLVYNNRHLAFMNHNIYFSRLGDHTDFTTGEADGTEGSVYPVYPGEGDGIIGATVFKGALLVFKRPFGVYLVQWNGQDLNTAGNVQITRISDSFAIASPHAATQLLNDLIGGAASGSLFSQSATNAFGSLEAGDLLQQAAVRNYFRQNFAYGGIPRMHSAYYTDKIIGMFTGVDNAANTQNRILMYDSAGQSPRISVETKDQPNCLFMRKDTNFVPRPFYGSADGNIYQMDQSVASVNGVAYTGEFQTPYIDFSFLDPKLSEKTKLFDFLSVTYENLGNWAFYVDVYVDGSFIQTLTFNMKQSSSTLDNFVLDKDTLGGSLATLTLRQPLKSCSGKAISFRIYNGLLNQTFTVERLIVSFRESGEQNRSSK